MRLTHFHRHSGFSLVEVVLALGVAAFCLLTVFGLLPIGVNTNHDAVEETGAGNIARAIVSDLRQTPPFSSITTGTAAYSNLFQIPIPPPTKTPIGPDVLFFREDGSVAESGTTVTINQQANPSQNPHFRATIYFGFYPYGALVTGGTTRTATNVRVLITWPGLADVSGTGDPVHFTGSYEAETALDRN